MKHLEQIIAAIQAAQATNEAKAGQQGYRHPYDKALHIARAIEQAGFRIVRSNLIKWLKEPDEPVYKSANGRFDIEPLFMGRERPQGWTVVDNETKARKTTHGTLKDAQEIAEKMLSYSIDYANAIRAGLQCPK